MHSCNWLNWSNVVRTNLPRVRHGKGLETWFSRWSCCSTALHVVIVRSRYFGSQLVSNEQQCVDIIWPLLNSVCQLCHSEYTQTSVENGKYLHGSCLLGGGVGVWGEWSVCRNRRVLCDHGIYGITWCAYN